MLEGMAAAIPLSLLGSSLRHGAVPCSEEPSPSYYCRLDQSSSGRRFDRVPLVHHVEHLPVTSEETA
jgi:hypothetical protein